jgi:hypothetical protein
MGPPPHHSASPSLFSGAPTNPAAAAAASARANPIGMWMSSSSCAVLSVNGRAATGRPPTRSPSSNSSSQAALNNSFIVVKCSCFEHRAWSLRFTVCECSTNVRMSKISTSLSLYNTASAQVFRAASVVARVRATRLTMSCNCPGGPLTAIGTTPRSAMSNRFYGSVGRVCHRDIRWILWLPLGGLAFDSPWPFHPTVPFLCDRLFSDVTPAGLEPRPSALCPYSFFLFSSFFLSLVVSFPLFFLVDVGG